MEDADVCMTQLSLPVLVGGARPAATTTGATTAAAAAPPTHLGRLRENFELDFAGAVLEHRLMEARAAAVFLFSPPLFSCAWRADVARAREAPLSSASAVAPPPPPGSHARDPSVP